MLQEKWRPCYPEVADARASSTTTPPPSTCRTENLWRCRNWTIACCLTSAHKFWLWSFVKPAPVCSNTQDRQRTPGKLMQRPHTEFSFVSIIFWALYLIKVVRVQWYSAVSPHSRMASVFYTSRLLRAASMVSTIASRIPSCSSLWSVSRLRYDVAKTNEPLSLCSRLVTEHVYDGIQRAGNSS
jgi:hypothetical protein